MKVAQLSLPPYGLYSPWNFPGQNNGVGSLSLLQGNLPKPGIKPRSLALQADSLPSEPPGEPGAATMENNMEISQKIKIEFPYI